RTVFMKIDFKKLAFFLLSINSPRKLTNLMALFNSIFCCLMASLIVIDFLRRGWILATAGALVALYAQYKIRIGNWNHVLRQNSEKEVKPFSKECWIMLNSLGLRLLGPLAIFGATLLIYTFMLPSKP